MTTHFKAGAQRTAAQLSHEHDQLEQWFIAIAQSAATGNARDCDALWSGFTAQLERHMAFEEAEVFPRYERQGVAQAAIAARLRQQHAAIREQLDSLGLDLQLHLARSESIGAFMVLLREHARRENESIYPSLLGLGTQIGGPPGNRPKQRPTA